MSCARAAGSNQFLAVYKNGALSPFRYALYNESTEMWTSSFVSAATSVISDISCCYGATGGGINVASYVGFDGDFSPPDVVQTLYYNGTAWPGTFITVGFHPASGTNPYVSFNNHSSQFLMTWLDATPSPHFTTSSNGTSWSSEAAVSWTPPGDLSSVSGDIYSAGSTLDSTFMITWQVVTTAPSQNAFFAFGSNPASPTASGEIPNSSNVSPMVFSSFDPNNNQYIVTWVDSSTEIPMYIKYDVAGATWLPNGSPAPAPIPGADAAIAAYGVTSTLDSTNNILLFTWVKSGGLPKYVTYQSALVSPWGTPTLIGGGVHTPASTPVFCAYQPNPSFALDFLATWGGTSAFTAAENASTTPYYVAGPLVSPSTTTVTTSPNPSQVMQKVTLIATVSPNLATGTVTFYVNGVRVGSAPVVGGVATLKVTMNCEGDSTVRAVYSGDIAYIGSSGSAIHTVECSLL